VHEGTDLDVDFLGGEADVEPAEGESANGQVWMELISPEDMVNLKNHFYEQYGSYQTEVVSYAFTWISSKADQSGFLWVGSDDGVKIWLNGEVAWTDPSSGSHRLAEDRVPIMLKAGENRLLVKVKNEVGNYAFSLAVVDEDGDTLPGIYYHTERWTDVAESGEVGGRPTSFALMQNYPNPFNPTTTIAYDLAQATNVTLTIYTITGQKVGVLVDARQEAGHHTVHVDGSSLATGVYLYRLKAEGLAQTRRMVLLR
jgi:hypothetical protein